ncbi:hypothetical protein TCAL_15671 [Tigriopus californicus]|uniref:Uncharacterized protein n=1 Tax=Tigriopus californicus TaxID=6832 RepID=A0A553PA64_TIGCA|nr:hypothetical protein TCAL_15671 [Tigriopus californicus]
MRSPAPDPDTRNEVVAPLPAHLYSCRHLFPADLTSPRPSESTRVWQGVSALTVSSSSALKVVKRLFRSSVSLCESGEKFKTDRPSPASIVMSSPPAQ